jgi:anti-sigma regulatory factor (Ser/Thr protein kinase)
MIISGTTQSIPVIEQSQVAEARRQVAAVATLMNLDETEVGRASIVSTELATNLLKHASGGQVLITRITADRDEELSLISIDTGPGMRSVEECMRDGFSTAGSAGSGLGALSRLSTSLEIYTRQDAGTVVSLRLGGQRSRPQSEPGDVDIFSIAAPHPQEWVSGDAWCATKTERGWRIMVVDGLGHGTAAATAATTALDAYQQLGDVSPSVALETLHLALRSTRGAVGAVAEVDLIGREVIFAGIGNIAAVITSTEGTKRTISHNGTLGLQVRKFQEFRYPFPRNAALILHSDGLATHWDLGNYPGLLNRSAALISAVLFRDMRRMRDDATIVTIKEA